MSFLTERERHTLALVCETLIPSLPADSGDDERLFRPGALHMAAQVEAAFERVTDASQQRQLRLFFQMIKSGLFNRITAEYYAVVFRKKVYTTLEELQADVDEWIERYNRERTHTGKYCLGRTPLQTFRETKHLAQAKMLDTLIEPEEGKSSVPDSNAEIFAR